MACQKPGQSDPLYGSKSHAKKWAWMGIFKPAEPDSPWVLVLALALISLCCNLVRICVMVPLQVIRFWRRLTLNDLQPMATVIGFQYFQLWHQKTSMHRFALLWDPRFNFLLFFTSSCINPFNASCSKLLLFKGFSAILV